MFRCLLDSAFGATLHHCSVAFRLWPQSWVVWTLWQHHLQFIEMHRQFLLKVSKCQKLPVGPRFLEPRNSSSIVGWFFHTPQRSSCGWAHLKTGWTDNGYCILVQVSMTIISLPIVSSPSIIHFFCVSAVSPQSGVRKDLLNRIDLEQPLWAVLDCAGGLKKVCYSRRSHHATATVGECWQGCLIPDSLPPTPEEANAPEDQKEIQRMNRFLAGFPSCYAFKV